eukprot:3944488-Prymnesium_polylepis.1
MKVEEAHRCVLRLEQLFPPPRERRRIGRHKPVQRRQNGRAHGDLGGQVLVARQGRRHLPFGGQEPHVSRPDLLAQRDAVLGHRVATAASDELALDLGPVVVVVSRRLGRRVRQAQRRHPAGEVVDERTALDDDSRHAAHFSEREADPARAVPRSHLPFAFAAQNRQRRAVDTSCVRVGARSLGWVDQLQLTWLRGRAPARA